MFTLVEHLFTPGKAHENISCIFFPTEVSSPFFVGKNLPWISLFWLLSQGFVQPRSFDRGRSENKSKQKDKSGRGGGGRCLHCIIWQSFLFFAVLWCAGSWSATSLQPWQMGLGEKWEFCSQETNQNVRSMFALYLSKIMEITVYPSSCCSSHIQAQMIIKCNQNTLHLRWKN